MPTFSHTHASDPLALATAGDIVLVDQTPAIKREIIDILSEASKPLADSAKTIRGVVEVTVNYELKSTALTVQFGANVNTDWRIISASYNAGAGQYPTLSLTAIKPESGSFATAIAVGSLEFPGGFGLLTTLFGASCAAPISCTASVSGQTVMAITHDTGAILAEGLSVYGHRADISIEGYSAITGIDPSLVVSSGGPSSGREAYGRYSLGFRKYLD